MFPPGAAPRISEVLMLFLTNLTRAVAAVIGAGTIAGTFLVGSAGIALADPPPPAPGCSAADFEQVKSQVASATAGYMFTHPDVNAFFSSLRGQPKDQIRGQVADYLANNPQAKSDLEGIRQPVRDMKNRCQ
jgi:hemophore-related protein